MADSFVLLRVHKLFIYTAIQKVEFFYCFYLNFYSERTRSIDDIWKKNPTKTSHSFHAILSITAVFSIDNNKKCFLSSQSAD